MRRGAVRLAHRASNGARRHCASNTRPKGRIAVRAVDRAWRSLIPRNTRDAVAQLAADTADWIAS
jgi:hypothetical protein